jgi:hypothetical protein
MDEMKNLIIAAIAMMSLNAFAQSYVIMSDGIVITLDRDANTFDGHNNTEIENISLKGGQFFVEGSNIITTIDDKGNLFRKFLAIPAGILGKGASYFVSEAGELFTINRMGFVTVTSDELYQSASTFGGNYFFTGTDSLLAQASLFTITADGAAVHTEVPGLHESEITIFGGNYFITNKGALYTISSEGVVTKRPEAMMSVIDKVGGNFFLTAENNLYTIAANGDLVLPGFSTTLRLKTITKLGSNFFIDLSGRLWGVDTAGNVFERVMTEYDFRDATVISL